MLALHDAVWSAFHTPHGDIFGERSPSEPEAASSLPLRAQREAFTNQIMMTLLTNDRLVEAYSTIMCFVERNESVDAISLDPKLDELFMGLLSMLEYVAINFLSNTIDREMLLRQRRSGLIRVYETLSAYTDYKRTAWNRPNAYRSVETLIRDYA